MFAARTADVNHDVTNGGGPLCSCLFTCGNSRVTRRLGVRDGRSVRGRATGCISYFAAMDSVATGRYGRLLSGPISFMLPGKFSGDFMPGTSTFAGGHGRTEGHLLSMTGTLVNASLSSSALVISADNHCRFHGGNVSICVRTVGHLLHSDGLGGGILTFVSMPN